MDQVKIGKFIAERRKQIAMTQAQLADMLGLTNRAVSKWETGKALPDSSIMLELCGVLGITVNDLLCGEIVTMENHNKEMEQNLLEIIKRKEEADKWLLKMEIVIAALCLSIMSALITIASLVPMEEWLKTTLISVGVLPFLIACPFMLRIEQVAGYYECGNCGHRYVPTFKTVNLAPHIGRARYIRCLKCNKKSWHKKVLTKE